HLLGPDACIFWARTPTSTLHKSAQQWAPDAYISLCKSTTQDTRAPRGYTRPHMHAPRDACISFVRVQEMRAPLPSARALKRCVRLGTCRDVHVPLLLPMQR